MKKLLKSFLFVAALVSLSSAARALNPINEPLSEVQVSTVDASVQIATPTVSGANYNYLTDLMVYDSATSTITITSSNTTIFQQEIAAGVFNKTWARGLKGQSGGDITISVNTGHYTINANGVQH